MATSASAVTRMRSPSTCVRSWETRRATSPSHGDFSSRAVNARPRGGRVPAACGTRRGDDQAHRRPGRIEAGGHPQDAAGQVGDRSPAELAGQLGDDLLEDATGLGRGDEDDPQADRLVRHRGEGGGQLGAMGRLEAADALDGLRRPRHDGVVDGRAGREHRRRRSVASAAEQAADPGGIAARVQRDDQDRRTRQVVEADDDEDLPATRLFQPFRPGRQESDSLGDRAGRSIAGHAGRQRPDVETGQVELHDGQDVRIDEGGQRPGPGIISRRLRGLSPGCRRRQQTGSSAWDVLPSKVSK